MHYDEAIRHCIFRFISGSHQYGTNRPDSDLDRRGVFIAPLSAAFDLFQTSFVGSGAIKQALHSAIDAIEMADLHAAKNSIENALAIADGLDARLDALCKESTLRDSPDRKRLRPCTNKFVSLDMVSHLTRSS